MLNLSRFTGGKTLSLYYAETAFITAVVKQEIKVNRLFRCDAYNHLMRSRGQDCIRVDKQAGTCWIGIGGSLIDNQ